ncbi:outer membrane receptor protein involved in Fe transport [Rhizomicrobium palustre]|uniref:Outer membrane receptor protein involved in Fe transport n=1 Tax=Rhizomicrobium palustre TaxID=189966 RepID=A0A846N2S2_9PROT|nr:TonB-dependent receptor [Rhizomicrobium palustre]NIK89522.1 outer membrane receptor protein involved in Fe transport [Rhizomicrobium palustre]
MSQFRMFQLLVGCSAMALLMASGASAQTRTYDVPAQSAIKSIPEFARQAGIQIVSPADKLDGVATPAVTGTMELHDALAHLVRGTGLRVASNDDQTVVLKLAEAKEARSGSAANAAEIETVTITASRVISDAANSPTPLTVLGAEDIELKAAVNIADQIGLLPALAATSNPRNTASNISGGIAGISALNLRGLGQTRTLVLLDGQRLPAATLSGWIDINTIPSGLIKRVDVVTGGASAAWGSDAIAGVVNFVIDKNFTGLKGEVLGGATTYGDDPTFKASLSAGTSFAGGRGHVLLSAETWYNGGLTGLPRSWYRGSKQLYNPAYTATNGQPQILVRQNVGYTTIAPGAIVTSGPMRGLYFGANGAPAQLNYGSLVSDPFMVGGDWKYTDFGKDPQDLDPEITHQSAYGRVSYDVTNGLELYGEFTFSHAHSKISGTPYFSFGGLTIQRDNAFLPASVSASMSQLGLNSLTVGSWNADMGPLQSQTDHTLYRYVVGAKGVLQILGSEWSWDIYGNRNVSEFYDASLEPIKANYAKAIDAVIGPNGAIVCRSSLATPGDGCVPLNILGTGVASQTALNYVMGNSNINAHITQSVVSGTVRGEPISTWAGPVAVAAGVEYRRESEGGRSDPLSLTNGYWAGNYKPITGSYDVTEGFMEVLVPLLQDGFLSKSWDLNAAVRATNYSTSGYVTTWKVGTTYAPFEDVKFRLTKSRDIRAANLSELYTPGAAATTTLSDPFLGNKSYTVLQLTTGNPTISPEKADTFDIGAVLSPQFLPGFSASADYWDIDIRGAISTLSASTTVNQCYLGNQALCGNIVRDGSGQMTQVYLRPINLAKRLARGLDFEANYQIAVSDISPELGEGQVSLRALVTHYLKSVTDDGISGVTSSLGVNSGGVPHWLYSARLTYASGPVTLSLTGRGVSAGVLDPSYVECSANCPASTAAHRTIDNNSIDGTFAIDTSFAYEVSEPVQMFLNVDDITNEVPAQVANGISIGSAQRGVSNYYYDLIGRSFRAGVRFKF